MTASELEFFNRLSGRLEVELTVPPEQMGNLTNLQASPDAEVVSVKLKAEVFDEDAEDGFRDLTEEELNSVAFRRKSIQLRGESGDAFEFDAPNGSYFTVQQLLQVVEETERQSRNNTEWFDGVWDICWGS